MANKAIMSLYFDVISPYSFIALESILRYEKLLPVQLQLKPITLAGVFQAAHSFSPFQHEIKEEYLKKDILLAAKYWGIDLSYPADFLDTLKHGSILAQRFLTAVDQRHANFLRPTALALCSRLWSSHKPIHEEKDFREIHSDLNLSNIDQLLIDAKSPNIKSLLQDRTHEAIESGAFGAPWIVIKDEHKADRCFFGSDRLPIICNELGVEYQGPLK